MKERSSSFIFGFVREKEPLVSWAVSVLCFFAARLHGGEAGCMEALGFSLASSFRFVQE